MKNQEVFRYGSSENLLVSEKWSDFVFWAQSKEWWQHENSPSVYTLQFIFSLFTLMNTYKVYFSLTVTTLIWFYCQNEKFSLERFYPYLFLFIHEEWEKERERKKREMINSWETLMMSLSRVPIFLSIFQTRIE